MKKDFKPAFPFDKWLRKQNKEFSKTFLSQGKIKIVFRDLYALFWYYNVQENKINTRLIEFWKITQVGKGKTGGKQYEINA